MSAMFNDTPASCATAPESIPSDAGVAGAGILLAFIITAGLALLLSVYIIFSEFRSSHSPKTISRKLLLGLSDQHTVEGIAIQAVGLARLNTMVPYHFFMIWMLSLLSTATNFAALLALVQDFKRDWVLRWLRQAAMFANLCLTVTSGVLVLKINWDELPGTLPVGCIWRDDHTREGQSQTNNSLSVAGTIAIIAVSCIIFVLGTWYLHLRTQVWGRSVRVVSLIIMSAIAAAATVRVISISQAFGKPSVELSDMGETEWSFGQLLTMLLLLLPFISALEIYRGEIQVPNERLHVDLDQIPLTNGDGDEHKPSGRARYSYQSNPWFK